MGIIFKGGISGGTCVGHIESGGIVFAGGISGGTCVGHIESNGTVFSGGISGGTCVGRIESNDAVFSGGISGGTCIGHVEGGDSLAGGAALLLGLLDSRNTNNTDRKKPSGCLGWLGAYIFLLTRNWGGRIGLLLGVVVFIIILATGQAHDLENGIFIGFFAILLLGTIGGIIGAIINFIKKLANKNK